MREGRFGARAKTARWLKFGMHGATIGLGALLALGALGCGGGSAPPAPAKPAEAKAAKPPPPAPPPTASAPPPTKNEVVIHQADLHGKIKGRAGKKVTIEPLVATSEILPVQGNKGALYREQPNAQDEWVLVADIAIARTMVAGQDILVDIVDEKKDARLDGKKVNHFVPGTMVRLQWQWE
jgi:hypothetical protein